MQPEHLLAAIRLSETAVQADHGGPFGAVIVRDGRIVGEGGNRVTSTNDPTAHAEIVAIRDACQHLHTFSLAGCEMYVSCEPCPMCLGAIFWARVERVYFAATRRDAAMAGFDDARFYHEIALPPDQQSVPLVPVADFRPRALEILEAWQDKEDRVHY
jgi:tRNA(Arg) A34 adenosine deaminase TadA